MQRDNTAAVQSVQTRATQSYGMQGPDAFVYFNMFQRPVKLYDVPLWGGSNRDVQLRRLWRFAGAEPIQAAISSDIQKIQSTSWTLEGPKRVARQVHAMLHNADFGQGWEEFLARIILDYRTQDNGMFVEIIGAGDPAGPLVGPVLGIAHIDAARCTRTGDIEYPVTYFDLNGARHKLHYTRVVYAADMPASEERLFGMGYCALSRCVAAAQSLIMWSEMRNELLDDMPPLGIVAMNGINKQAFDTQYKGYMAERAAKEQDIYRGLLMLFGVGQKIEVNMTPFRQLWDGFEDKRFIDTMIDLVAMAFNMDRQELAQLSGGRMGSGNESQQMGKKSRGKGIHNLLNMIERIINRLTPESVVFRFDFQDHDEELQKAQIHQMKLNSILAMFTAKQPDSNVSIDTVSQTTPAINGSSEGLISKVEARYLAVKEGILPRELLSEEDNLRPDWQRFDDVTIKAMARFGPCVLIEKAGRERPYDSRLLPQYLGMVNRAA